MFVVFKHFGLLLVYIGLTDCEMIANNTFTVTNTYPTGNGVWRAHVSCYTNFPGHAYAPNNAWIVTRYGVQITNYQDYLNGNSIEIDPDGLWVISNVGNGSSGGSLSYSFEFSYDLWFGNRSPSGDCHQFTDIVQAEQFALNNLYPPDAPSDTLIATDTFERTTFTADINQGACHFSFPGITFGANEAVILVSFTVPIDYVNDSSENIILDAADDQTWYIIQEMSYYSDSSDYTVHFRFKTANEDLSSAVCYLYVSESDARAAAQGQTSPPTTSSISTNPVTPVPLNSFPIIDLNITRHNKSEGKLIELQQMRNKYVHEGHLWEKVGVSLVQCGRLCLADSNCISVFHQADEAACTAHHVVYSNGISVPGVTYYKVLQ
ncbi:uncharacterized protein LOC132758921 [Ruditapes philippinarum]|uniref:uncharacterized protein LOC132758921 n=1 Tax=Ruditapes philippinarum TaxID=129788 RepID=UPI00295A7A5D|nr:uncharacterized protein LOC132758921 [Ruditapes philippinarum]